MPRLNSSRLAAACVLALVLVLGSAVAASAKQAKTTLRVVGAGNRVLADEALFSGNARIPTSPKALCFGKGTGGSGKSVGVTGPTALGLLDKASQRNKALQPLSITDSFSFGLGICGVGKSTANSKLSWYLKVNHKNPERAGEKVKLKPEDEVLWALAPFPYPEELYLESPTVTTPGAAFPVRVWDYNDKGKRTPVSGAKVTGGTALTAKDGRTTVVLSSAAVLRATHFDDIPSNGVEVCVGGDCR